MPKKTLLLILFLATVTSLLVFLAIDLDRRAAQVKNVKEEITPTNKEIARDVEIFFVPSKVVISPAQNLANNSQTHTADIYINSRSTAVVGIQLEMFYDTQVIYDVAVSSPQGITFLGDENQYTVLFKDTDSKNGRISYAVKTAEDQVAKMGVGKIATVFFKVNTLADPAKQVSEISFINKTMITRPNSRESVLEKTIPLKIEIKEDITPTAIPVSPTETIQTTPSETGQACIQVIQPARNPATGECKDFPTPCDVPAGWEKVGSCNNQ